ncbi:MAG: FHA domain-containing protein [Gammaproteobacteria bacterium]|nr:FHA domain-containing protein [Gammaproteobacteria bacterium]MCW8911540.1 FHA domain-containing protein [Gammaproteobacteria bacterium]MCW9005114.1 FHA domain-containing protein [Gammaproteobacteria bacterium]MCW9055938.1 FHA domain-containing protein [Gammaproteobacteria bacterium]
MATIKIIFNGDVIQETPLNKEVMSIGRKPDNDIQIDNLAVSSHHAKITSILNDSFIEDNDSTNGTYVNGTLIKKQVLRDGDVIRIGKHDLKYINENASVSSEDEFEKTMIIRPDAAGMPVNEGDAAIDRSVGKLAAEIASADSGTKTSSGTASVKLLNGANSGKELPLTKILTTLGKPGVQVAAITKRPTGYFLIHIDGGDNEGRPRVNDSEIGTQAHALQNNDTIEVAGVKMSFFLG